jgi:hypothetical protein
MSKPRPILCPAARAGSWFGIGAPKATASSVIRQLKTPLLSRPGFLLGACREHPQGMLKEAARGSRYLWRFSAIWLALPSATAAEFLSCSNGSAHARSPCGRPALTINRDRNSTFQFIPTNVISCVARPRNKERKNYLSNWLGRVERNEQQAANKRKARNKRRHISTA